MATAVLLLLLLGALGTLLGLFLSWQELKRHRRSLVTKLKALQTRCDALASSDAEATRLREEHRTLFEKYRSLQTRYGGLANLETEADRIRQQMEESRKAIATLNAKYEKAKTIHDALEREVSHLEENLEDISFGLYKPHYSFRTSEGYKVKLEEVRNQLKEMARAGNAVTCSVEWTVGNSRQEGQRMQKQYSKLLLRAFNGECEAAVAKVSWNNVSRMEERIKKAFEAINELGGVMQISITPEFYDLRLAELRLEYEMEERKHQEAEEQRRVKERMREEEKVRREREKAVQKAEEAERLRQEALAAATAEAAKATGEELRRLNEQIQVMGEELRAAREEKDRAISNAEKVRNGYVYIISNIGSFGEHVFKIGMTRRDDPMDRVRELGDASVPFEFDVHALIYSEDAPALESELHEHFDRKRVNLANTRREFFNITIDEITAFARAKNVKAEITRLAEAKEYRETLSLRMQEQREGVRPPSSARAEAFPTRLDA